MKDRLLSAYHCHSTRRYKTCLFCITDFVSFNVLSYIEMNGLCTDNVYENELVIEVLSDSDLILDERLGQNAAHKPP